MTPAQTLDAIADDLEKVASVITTARRLIREARAVDLGVLDGKMAQVCRAVAALPPEQGRLFLPALEAVLGGLDDLEQALKAHADPSRDPPALRATQARLAYGRLPGAGCLADDTQDS